MSLLSEHSIAVFMDADNGVRDGGPSLAELVLAHDVFVIQDVDSGDGIILRGADVAEDPIAPMLVVAMDFDSGPEARFILAVMRTVAMVDSQ